MLQYPWEPHKSLNLKGLDFIDIFAWPTYPTREDANNKKGSFLEFLIDQYLITQINDGLHLSIQNALNHTTDQETLSLANGRIPTAARNDSTLRFLIAFMHEKEIEYPKLYEAISIRELRSRYAIRILGKNLFNLLADCGTRASKIVEIMEDASDKVGSALAQQPDFIRTAALIDLGEKTGIEITSKANAISFNVGETSDQGNTISRTLAANSSFFMEKASDFRVAGTRANNTDTLKIVSKNGPNEITVTTNRVPVKSVLAKDAKKTLVNAELMGSVVSTQPIEVPKATRTLPDIGDLEVAEVQSVNLIGLFNGIRVNVTASSGSDSIATVSVNENTTSMGVTGVAVGTTTITVTGTNEAGAVSVTFDLTIIAAEDDE